MSMHSVVPSVLFTEEFTTDFGRVHILQKIQTIFRTAAVWCISKHTVL